MGIHEYIFGAAEGDRDAEADRLRAAALERPAEVDVARLVDLFLTGDSRGVTRSAAKGLVAVAEREPARLAGHVADLIEGTTVVDGVGASQRGEVATAVERVAEVDPGAVAAHDDALIASLALEIEVDNQPGTDARLHEAKAAALGRAAGEAAVTEARPVLKQLRHHTDPRVSDAAREAIRLL